MGQLEHVARVHPRASDHGPAVVPLPTFTVNLADAGSSKFATQWQKMIDAKLLSPVVGWTDAGAVPEGPDGLSGAQIPIEARIVAVADSFDAMTTRRPYRDARPPAAAAQLEPRDTRTDADSSLRTAVAFARLAVGAVHRARRIVAARSKHHEHDESPHEPIVPEPTRGGVTIAFA